MSPNDKADKERDGYISLSILSNGPLGEKQKITKVVSTKARRQKESWVGVHSPAMICTMVGSGLSSTVYVLNACLQCSEM